LNNKTLEQQMQLLKRMVLCAEFMGTDWKGSAQPFTHNTAVEVHAKYPDLHHDMQTDHTIAAALDGRILWSNPLAEAALAHVRAQLKPATELLRPTR
jgi:hypothetical protein